MNGSEWRLMSASLIALAIKLCELGRIMARVGGKKVGKERELFDAAEKLPLANLFASPGPNCSVSFGPLLLTCRRARKWRARPPFLTAAQI